MVKKTYLFLSRKKQEIPNCLETVDLKIHWKLVKGNMEAMIL